MRAPSDPKNCPAYAACGTYARERDPSRFTTWADDQDNRGACYEHATLIAYNNYPGWCCLLTPPRPYKSL